MRSTADSTLFAATIRPHRSLTPAGARLVISLVAVAGVVSSIPFIVLGAWPVAGYFGLDVLLLFIALMVNLKRGGAREEVRLTYLELGLRKITHRGAMSEWRFNPSWVRLERVDDEDYGLQRLTIVSGQRTIDVASQLSPHERDDFALALSKALVEAKRGPAVN